MKRIVPKNANRNAYVAIFRMESSAFFVPHLHERDFNALIQHKGNRNGQNPKQHIIQLPIIARNEFSNTVISINGVFDDGNRYYV